MKLTNFVLGIILVIGLAGFAGCKKKAAARAPEDPVTIEGVKVDLPKLMGSIDAGGNAELQASVRNVQMSLRYRQWDKTLAEMEKLAANPNLNDEQKKLANEVFEQLKQVAAKAPPPAQ